MVFNSPYMAFDPHAEPYQRADDVGYAVSEFMWFKGRPFYPASALVQARISHAILSEANRYEDDEDNRDLIFQMPKAEGGHFFEIVLRSNERTTYGGWLWGEKLEILNQFINGYRVLATRFAERQVKFTFSESLQRYQPTDHLPFGKSMFLITREAIA